jgi:hypothetical protein
MGTKYLWYYLLVEVDVELVCRLISSSECDKGYECGESEYKAQWRTPPAP